MNWIDDLAEHIETCFAGLWIVTREPDEAMRAITELCRERAWDAWTWDADRGLSGTEEDINDPLAAVRHLTTFDVDSTRSLTG